MTPLAPSTAPERLALALEAGAIVGTWVWDIPNDLVTADERFSQFFGIPAQRCATGVPIAEAFASVHPQDVQRLAQAIEQAMACGGAFRCEYRVRHDDGNYRWVEANGSAQLDAAGRAVRFPGVLMNIEARKQAEAERDQAMALLKTFIAAVPGVVYAKDLEGRLLVANDGATRLIGKPPAFYLGKTDLDILEDKAQARQIMATDRRIMQGGRAEQIEEQVSTPDGAAATWLSVKAPLLDDTGAVVGLVGSSIDVTARKDAENALLELNRTLEARISAAVAEREAAEEALRQAQKMDAIGQLTGGIAHDFNNLLAGITGSLELMRLRLQQGRAADADRYVDVAQGAAQRAAALTHRLLAFSRRQTLVPVHTDVHGLIRGMQELICRTVGPAITLQVNLQAAASVCLVDAAQVENSLLNLCINARDALAGTGLIAISTANTTEGGGPPLLTICIADTGVGMAPEVLAKAVEPFFTTKPIGAGTGLGLSMVYGFAKQSGGQLRIESEQGQGTRIFLALPCSTGPAEALASPVAAAAVPAPELRHQVLVVDDEPTVRLFVCEALQGLACHVLEAADGASALELIERGAAVDLLVTDIGLPGALDGYQLAAAVQALRPGLPVVFMTGYAEPAAPGGAPLALLTKPFTLDALLKKVEGQLN